MSRSHADKLRKDDAKKAADPNDFQIKHIRALEILDSRGNPTVRVQVELNNGVKGTASVPSGASVGTDEALELRDGGGRFGGKGVSKAVLNAQHTIFNEIKGMDARNQKAIDDAMIKLDGTENKSHLGANAMLGVSLAVARAAANAKGTDPHEHLAELFTEERMRDENGNSITDKSQIAKINATSKGVTMPTPMMNLINGGAHANNSLDFQEIMVVPTKATSMADATRMGAEVFHELKKILGSEDNVTRKKHSTSVGDEGGFAPNLTTEQALETINQAIKQAGHEGKMAIALDVAASEFAKKGEGDKYNYELDGEKKKFTSEGMVDHLLELRKKYNIISIEDGMGEKDKKGWELLTKKFKEYDEQNKTHTQLVGDDLFVTNTKKIKEGIQDGIANSVLIKVNQIGTLSETLEAIKTAQNAGYTAVISHRSGETADTMIADIAVATNAGQIKTGSLSRADRTEKYNRLMEIEAWELMKNKDKNIPKEKQSFYAGEKGFNVIELFKKVENTVKENIRKISNGALGV